MNLKQKLAAVLLTAAAVLPAAEKQIYAHFMGCWPASRQAGWLRSGKELNRFRSVPLFPETFQYTLEECAELEIRRAIRGGFDGFAVDAWAGGKGAQNYLDVMFKVCESKNIPFKLTVCMDASCHDNVKGDRVPYYIKTLKGLIEKHGKSPNLARRDGKILIFGYSSKGIRQTEELNKMKETPEKWALIRKAYKEVEDGAGVPVFWHFCMENMPQTVESGAFLGKNYNAVGGFVGEDNGRWRFRKGLADAVKKAGAEWSQPMIYQYWNKGMSPICRNGLDILFENWQAARDTDSTLIQFVTWNDYGEETQIAPTTAQNYTVLDINRYMIQWWKLGKQPDVKEDTLHVVYRRHPAQATAYPFAVKTHPAEIVPLEVVSILTKPGTVEVPGYGSYEAPAGLFRRQFPLKPGIISAKLIRDGKTVISMTAPERVTDKPFRSDFTAVCFSSNFNEWWKADFPDAKPYLFSEYGDIDNDGLPNWFEMYWFGKYPDLNTASAADPAADPDGDGLTNLQEYRMQSNPVKKLNMDYPAGYKWNFDHIFAAKASSNPDYDLNENPVWYYFYRTGVRNGPVPDDLNDLQMCNSQLHNRGRNMMQLTPNYIKDLPGCHGWLRRIADKDGKTVTEVISGTTANVIIAFKAPVDMKADVSFKVTGRPGSKGAAFRFWSGKTLLAKETFNAGGGTITYACKDMALKKGECLYWVFPRPLFSSGVVIEDMELIKK